jgi:hypothetical protein
VSEGSVICLCARMNACICRRVHVGIRVDDRWRDRVSLCVRERERVLCTCVCVLSACM